MVEAGASRGVRHIVYSRSGYRRSERARGRSVADCAEDTVAVADQLGIDRFYIVGWSGGGPHALATASLLAERVIAAATLASPALRRAEELDWLMGMDADTIEEFGAADTGEKQPRADLDRHAPELARATGPELHAALGDLLSGVDGRVLTGEFAEHLATCTRAALKHGIWRWFDDDLEFVRDWGFDLGAISVAVAIWQAEKIGSPRTPMAAGWPSTSPAQRGVCIQITATSRSPSAHTTQCWTTSSRTSRTDGSHARSPLQAADSHAPTSTTAPRGPDDHPEVPSPARSCPDRSRVSVSDP
jgi:pimeloyl-ACP methyl ester carboxylesterase